jgi:hypothetical protein
MSKILFLAIALYFLVDLITVIFKRILYQPIEAQCVAVSETYIHTDNSSSYGRKGTFEYKYNNFVFREVEKGYPSGRKLKVGQNKIIYINKTNPRKFVSKDNIFRACIIDSIGVIVMMLAIYLA